MLEKIKSNEMLLSIIGIFVLIILVVGITYAGFSQTTSGGNNSISSGTITMSFQEPSNNVVITNAMPTSNGYNSTTHFDFSVSGTAKTALTIAYEISITEKAGNTINPDYVRIGLKKNGTIVYPYGIAASSLRSSSIRNGSKILIKGQFTLAQSGSNYTATDNYQLFLWLSENYEMPSDGSTESYSVTVNVNSNVGAVGITSTETYVVSSTTMNIGSALPNGVNGRSTPELAMADWAGIIGTPGANIPVYLRHVLNSSNEIEDSYVEFVVTEDMANANPGMVAGTYSLKGGYYGASYTSNVNVIKAAFGYSTNPGRCTSGSDYFKCLVSGLRAYANNDGYVDAGNIDNYGCNVDNDGSSGCGGTVGPVLWVSQRFHRKPLWSLILKCNAFEMRNFKK